MLIEPMSACAENSLCRLVIAAERGSPDAGDPTGADTTGEGAPSAERLSDHVGRPALGLVGQVDGSPVALAVAWRRTSFSGEAMHGVAVWVSPERQRRGIGRRLLGALLEALEPEGGTVIAFPAPENVAAETMLRAAGFHPFETTDRVVLDPDRLSSIAPQAGTGEMPTILGPADDRWDHDIAELFNRGFRGDPLVSPFLPGTVAGWRSDPALSLLALERDGGPAAVAVIVARPAELSLDWFLVARRHWGTGLAGEFVLTLSRLLVERARSAGIPLIGAVVRRRNAAIRRIYEEAGWVRTGSSVIWGRKVGCRTYSQDGEQDR
ncbi:GNAT family N-acetyltransferase [Skermanella pratensis]|uniref:GNAT family N-acetyltransferase n=1 Tax=Skermanella pratensis TaxID=2233999 RepID=UPI001787B59E|nr:GNAT family N-acetyltransferase [Skermanella pratensis]